MDNRPYNCARQAHQSTDAYRKHRQKCPRCRQEMQQNNHIALNQTDEQLAAVDERLDQCAADNPPINGERIK